MTRFKTTPFGPWLELKKPTGDPILVHMFLHREVDVENPEPKELVFDVCGRTMRFGAHEFCLVTGLRFGDTPGLPDPATLEFPRRLWSDYQHGKLKNKMVIDKFERGLHHLSVDDGVRLCLVMMVELMFLGREKSQYVSESTLRAVEDLELCHRYPWGTVIYEHLFKQLHRAVLKRTDQASKMTMSGFVYAFKVR